jgi:PAS domain S-box-containing protein
MSFRHNGIVMLDLQGRITFANAFACELTGFLPDEVVGLSCFDFVFAEDVESATALLEANKARHARPFRFRLRRKDGTPVWVDIQGSAIKTANGPVFGILAAITPIQGDSQEMNN